MLPSEKSCHLVAFYHSTNASAVLSGLCLCLCLCAFVGLRLPSAIVLQLSFVPRTKHRVAGGGWPCVTTWYILLCTQYSRLVDDFPAPSLSPEKLPSADSIGNIMIYKSHSRTPPLHMRPPFAMRLQIAALWNCSVRQCGLIHSVPSPGRRLYVTKHSNQVSLDIGCGFTGAFRDSSSITATAT